MFNIYDRLENQIACFEENGTLYDKMQNQLGKLEDTGGIYDVSGQRVAYIEGNNVYSNLGERLGYLESDTIYDNFGNILNYLENYRLLLPDRSILYRFDTDHTSHIRNLSLMAAFKLLGL